MQGGRVVTEWEAGLDSAAAPAALDLTRVNGATTLRANYAFAEGGGAVCYVRGGERRPTTFDKEGARRFLVKKRP